MFIGIFLLFLQRDYQLSEMRQFIKFTIASFTGTLGCLTILFILVLIAIGSIIAADSNDIIDIKDGSVLTINLQGDIAEHATENPLDGIMGGGGIRQGLDDITGAIDKAANTKEIRAIYIRAGIVSGDYASLQEIRQALLRAKAKKKLIVSYAKEYTQGAYYVCSAADQVWINPEGMLDLHGVAAQPMYIKDLLAKAGIKMTVVKVGKYKSATEQYTEDRMSDENRLQVTRYISGIWDAVTADISKSRGISTAEVNQCADELPMFRSSEYLLRHRLVDKTMYAEEVKTELKKLLKADKDKEINQITCGALNRSSVGRHSDKNRIAVYYCEGSVVRAKEAGAIMGDAGIVSTEMIRNLEELANDDNVKAVVVRINSGGGDAFASEEIWHAMKTLKAKKPVVVSMGGMAASGAYYLSCGASYIIAQPTTLTGSIGIFGAFPDMSGLITEKLGLKFDNVKTNKHSDFNMLQTARPFNAEETEMLQQYVNRGYELFCKRVAEGRGMGVEQVKSIAEGRVWLGQDALKVKLVDALGGTNEAIAKAALLAKIKSYETVTYPAEPSWLEQLTEKAGGNGNELDEQLRSTLGAFYEPFVLIRNIEQQCPVQARCEVIINNR